MSIPIYLFFHLISNIGQPIKPGRPRTIIAGNPRLIQQLLVHTRSTWVSDWTLVKTLFDASSLHNTDLDPTTDSPGLLASVTQQVDCGVPTCSALNSFKSDADGATDLSSYR